jgi:hypothetical protein
MIQMLCADTKSQHPLPLRGALFFHEPRWWTQIVRIC